MATLATTTVTLATVTTPLAAVGGSGDAFTPGPNVCLRFTNTSGSPVTVTVDSKLASNQGGDENVVITVPATTGDVMAGPFPADRFGDPTTGLGAIAYSATTNVKVGVVSL